MNRNKNNKKSKLTRRLLAEYFIQVFAFAVILTAAVLIAKWICSYFIWHYDNPIYRILVFIDNNLLFFAGTVFLIGYILITFFFIRRLINYIDQIAKAAQRLADPSPSPIVLPNTLINIQSEMNTVREQSINNARLAAEAEQRKNDMLVYLAHDLKTPLTSVIGYLDLLHSESGLPADIREKYSGIALNKAYRLEELINEFFEITRFNLTTLTLETERIDLSLMLLQLVSEFEPLLAQKHLGWRTDIAPDCKIVCDPGKLERVFDNLIRNAVYYSYPDTDIFIQLQSFDSGVQIKIANKGKTIPGEKLDRIFEQFFRIDSSRSTVGGGAGLGLAIAKELVTLHNGTISAASADESIVFTVQLPLTAVQH